MQADHVCILSQIICAYSLTHDAHTHTHTHSACIFDLCVAVCFYVHPPPTHNHTHTHTHTVHAHTRKHAEAYVSCMHTCKSSRHKADLLLLIPCTKMSTIFDLSINMPHTQIANN